MRKDVKFGLVIGGILLAVLVVYTLIVPSNTDEVAIENATPEYNDATANGELDVTHVASAAPEAGEAETPRVSEGPVATRVPPVTAPRVTETPVSASTDNWSTLLNEGTMPLMGTDSARHAAGRTPAVNVTPSDVADLPPLNSTEEEPGSALSPTDAVEPTGPIANAGTGPVASTATPRTHTVKSNETLSSIAKEYYGAASYYPHILRANPSIDANRLKVGTVLNIPDRAVVVSRDSASANSAVSSTAPLASNQYRVVSGDTLEKIAVKALNDGRRWQEIYDLNRQVIGNDPAKLKIGQVLQIPSTGR